MQSLVAVCEEADKLINIVKNQPTSVLHPKPQEQSTFSTLNEEDLVSRSSFCIHTKLKDLYLELSENKNTFVPNSLLLEKLVARERLNTLILNLCPGNKGYSFAIRTGTREEHTFQETGAFDQQNNTVDEDNLTNMIETVHWPYEEEDLLEYIDNEELPSFWLNSFEKNYPSLFYNGCIILEKRDYRQTYPQPTCDICYVLLKPSVQSILSDINNIMDKNAEWGGEERLQLESQLTLVTNPTLCLDPSPTVGVVANRLHHETHLLNTQPLRKRARKFSQVAVNRKRKLDQFTQHAGLELHDFITRLRTKSRTAAPSLLQMARVPKLPAEVLRPVPAPQLELPSSLTVPDAKAFTDVTKYFRAYQKPEVSDNFVPQLVEEYILETESKSKTKQPRTYHIQISILKRLANNEYIGELHLGGDSKKTEENGAACRFSLGTRANANRYIQQFTEIFTEIFAEEGNEPMKITHKVPGQTPRSTRTGIISRAAGLPQVQVASNAATRNIVQQQQQLQQQQAQAQMVQQAQYQVLQAQVQQQQLVRSQQQQPLPGTSGLSNGEMSQQGVQLLVQGTSQPVSSNTSVLQAQLQSNCQSKLSSQHLNNPKITALVQKLMSSAEEFEQNSAAEKAARASQPNSEIISRLNNTSLNLNNSLTNQTTVVGNALTNFQSANQKVIGTARKMTITNARTPPSRANSFVGASVAYGSSNGGAAVTVPAAASSQPAQSYTLTSAGFVPSNEAYHLKSSPLRSSNGAEGGVSGLSALLVGTPSADNPIPGAASVNSALLERLSATSGSAVQQQVQTATVPVGSPTQFPVSSPKYPATSPKSAQILSPMSSPPPQPQQPQTATLNVQSLNLGPFQTIAGLQNVQVQIPGLSAPISLLNVSSSAGTAHGTAGLIVSLPAAATATCGTALTQLQQAAPATASASSGPAMVLANALPLAQLMTSGVKGLNQQTLRAQTANATNPTAVQLVGLPRSRNTQLQSGSGVTTTTAAAVKLSARGLLQAQRAAAAAAAATSNNSATMPNLQAAATTIKMTPTSTNSTQLGATSNATVTLSPQQHQQLQHTLQKQAQLQQYQHVVTTTMKHHRKNSADTNK